MVTRNNYISKLKRHNEKALEFVVQEYGGQVKAAVYKNLSGMPEEIEECMDDVFLDVWNNIDRFDESKGSFRSWITAIARFRSIDYLRRYSRRCSDEDRDIILRYYWDDQCVDEIAEDYGVSSSSIYSRMSRARSRLKQV